MTEVEEWVAKAEGDYHLACAARRLRVRPEPDGVCYHCQQCAEKYLKAFLVAQADAPPRTHNLVDLLRRCQTYDPSLGVHAPDLFTLNQYGILIRYPGMSATAAEADAAIDGLRRVRRAVRKLLSL